jgi:death-on-curing protein
MTVWVSRKLILAVHDEMLARYGGASGIRDEGLLESALARPLNRTAYGEPDIAELAALYAIAIARNHPFIDGNKRAAFGAMTLFLSLNGLDLEAPEVEAAAMTLNMAAHYVEDEEFTAWVAAHATGPIEG